jgi:hypothetical protein
MREPALGAGADRATRTADCASLTAVVGASGRAHVCAVRAAACGSHVKERPASAPNAIRDPQSAIPTPSVRNPQSEPRDQAAGLRRLFARPSLGVLPVLVPAPRCAQRNAWLARLARAFVAAGSRTLVLDASRAQLATTFGLKARFDLLHALRGECEVAQARLDIGPGLALLPAVRAFDDAVRREASLAKLIASAAASAQEFDLAVALLAAPHVALLAEAGAEVAVPVAPNARDVAAALEAVRKCGQRADIAGFRWLFLGMDDAAAVTLARRLVATAQTWCAAPLRFGAAVRGAGDAARIVHAAAGWNTVRIELPERVRMS